MDASSAPAPPVVAVVVTCDPGEGFEEALAALGSQDHPELAVLVIDAGSSVDVTDRVAAALPSAYVRRLDGPTGYGEAANLVLDMVAGAAFLFFCHDDVAPASDAVRLLVDEAVRANAGIVVPKIVAWDDHERLLAVGIGVDRVGTPIPLVDRRELDQEQHDMPRELLAGPGAALLVRADLFAAIGGFDPAFTPVDAALPGGGPGAGPDVGEDVDLCWRARLAGARIVTAPAARVAHVEDVHRSTGPAAAAAPASGRAKGRTPGELARQRAVAVNRLVTPAKNLPLGWFLLFLPALLARTVRTVAWSLLRGPRTSASLAVRAWGGFLRRLPDVVRSRRAFRARRQVSYAEIRRLQFPLGNRIRQALREDVAEDSDRVFELAGRTISASVRGPRRWVVASLLAVAAVQLFGARDVLVGHIPVVGQFTELASPSVLARHVLSGWRTAGMGSASPAPPAFGVLAVVGTVLLGAMGLARKLLILGLLPAGLVGTWRVARRHAPGGAGVPAVPVAAVVAYAAAAVPYNALALGRWDGLVSYAAAPWLLALLLRTAAPAGADARRRPWWARVLPLGVPLAIGTMMAPSLPVVVVVLAGGFAAGSVLTGRGSEALRVVAAAGGGIAAAVLLLFPWSLTFLQQGSDWGLFTGGDRARAHPVGLGDLLRFHTGPAGGSVLGWAVAVGAALALVLATGDRFVWASRLCSTAVLGVGVVWLAGRGWAGDVVPMPEVVLAPVALALALALAGVVEDPRAAAFGWRQVAVVAGAGALAVATLPMLAGSVDGRWELPRRDVGDALAWLPAQVEQGPFRVLWIGSPDVLPVQGWRLGRDLSYATSRDGLPDVVTNWPGPAQGGTPVVADALREALATRTSRLGRLLGPMAVRYVVVVERLAPGGGLERRAPANVRDALRRQLDLRKLDADPGITVYENTAWAPQRIVLPAAAADASRLPGLAGARVADLHGALPALVTRSSPTSATGVLTQGGSLAVAESLSDRWSVRLAGRTVAPRRSFGWAMAFDLTPPAVGGVDPAEAAVASTTATLSFHPSLLSRLTALIQAALWVLAFALLRREHLARVRARRAAGGAPAAGVLDDATGDGSDGEEAEATVWGDTFTDETPAEGQLADELWEAFSRRRSLRSAGDRVADRDRGDARSGGATGDEPEDVGDDEWLAMTRAGAATATAPVPGGGRAVRARRAGRRVADGLPRRDPAVRRDARSDARSDATTDDSSDAVRDARIDGTASARAGSGRAGRSRRPGAPADRDARAGTDRPDRADRRDRRSRRDERSDEPRDEPGDEQ